MANCAALPSCAQLQSQRCSSRKSNRAPKTMYLRKHFNCKYGSIEWKESAINASLAISSKGNESHAVRFLKCCCVGSLVDPENAALLNWVPFLDQMLLTVSILLAYMAGVVPGNKVLLNTQKGMLGRDTSSSNSTTSGSTHAKSKPHSKLEDSWSEVKGKLLDGIDASDCDGTLCNNAIEPEKFSTSRPLSLLAISPHPRLRLLYTTLQQLHKAVRNISPIHEDNSWDAWLMVSLQLIQESIQPICREWLSGEISLENKEQDKDLINRIFRRLDGNDLVLHKIKRLEKGNLYADLFFFLRFGSLSSKNCYNNNMLTMYGVDILEDLVVTVADGISSMYLELISVDSNLCNEINGFGLSICALSTRSLQKLRNEVSLNAWLLQNFESIVSMYEDRFELCILQRKSSKESDTSESENFNWWKNILLRKTATSASPLQYILITQSPMFIKRTKELRALTGWRYYYSLFLEFSDITMPLIRAIFFKVRDAVSFFFVCLIGRSLGLIYTGIRQSLSWR